jgi:hypothetical protein
MRAGRRQLADITSNGCPDIVASCGTIVIFSSSPDYSAGGSSEIASSKRFNVRKSLAGFGLSRPSLTGSGFHDESRIRLRRI